MLIQIASHITSQRTAFAIFLRRSELTVARMHSNSAVLPPSLTGAALKFFYLLHNTFTVRRPLKEKSRTSHWASMLLECSACTLKGSYVGVLHCWKLHTTPRTRPNSDQGMHIYPRACHSFVATRDSAQLVSIASCEQATIETTHHICRPCRDACLTLASSKIPRRDFPDQWPGPRHLLLKI